MTRRTHNEFLSIGSSDDEDIADRDYDSEAAVERKGRAVKRRRTADKQTTHELESEGKLSDSEEDDDNDRKY